MLVYTSPEIMAVRGEEGIQRLKEAAQQLADILEQAVPRMGTEMKDICGHYLNDFKSNGLHMPMYGKIL